MAAAIDHFNDRGLSDVQIEEVAESAGVSSSVVNYHFKTKQNLIQSTCLYAMDNFKEKLMSLKFFQEPNFDFLYLKHFFEIQFETRFLFMDSRHLLRRYEEVEKAFNILIEEGQQLFIVVSQTLLGKGVLSNIGKEIQPLYFTSMYHSLISQINTVTFDKSIVTKEDFVLRSLQHRFLILGPYQSEEVKSRVKVAIHDYAVKNNISEKNFLSTGESAEE